PPSSAACPDRAPPRSAGLQPRRARGEAGLAARREKCCKLPIRATPEPREGLIIHAGFLRQQESHEVFANVPPLASRCRAPRTQLLHAGEGGATFCRPCLRVFVPHDFGFQPIRVAEENAQGSAEIGNGAILGP